MKLFLLITGLLAISVLVMAVKIIFKKGGTFDKTCASSSRVLNEDGEACGFCGALPEEKCKNEETVS